MKKQIFRAALAGALAAGISSAASAQVRGVTDDKVVIGSNADLSGIFASFNVQAVKAAQQYFDKVNEAGGIHGRKITMITEDHGYQVPKAIQNFNKLINRDNVFAMLLNLGTPINIAGFKLMEAHKIANVSPLSSARQMIEGDITYKYAGFSSYYDQMRAGVRYLANEKGAKTFCAMYLPNDFGKEIQQGTKEGAEEIGAVFKAETTHKGDEQDFTGSLTKLRDEGCDTIGIALSVRQVITVIGTAKKLGWDDVNILGSSAAFHTAVALVPGGVTEGFYAAAGWSDIAGRMDNPIVKAFVEEFKSGTGEDPGTAALLGRSAAEQFAMALEAAGADLTPESFQKGMESLAYRDELMDADIKFGPGDHQGGDDVIISQIVDGQWKELKRALPEAF